MLKKKTLSLFDKIVEAAFLVSFLVLFTMATVQYFYTGHPYMAGGALGATLVMSFIVIKKLIKSGAGE